MRPHGASEASREGELDGTVLCSRHPGCQTDLGRLSRIFQIGQGPTIPLNAVDEMVDLAVERMVRHVGRVLEWLEANAQHARAQLALIYAWNENDEGGWLVPTLSEGPARLVALRRVLRPRGISTQAAVTDNK